MNRLNRLLVILIFLSFAPAYSTEPVALPSAKEFLNMDLDQSLPFMEGLSKEQTKELITSLRQEAKASYPKIDHFYFLISHLEEVSAIEKEQARLKSLLWVFGLALVLFLGFLGFLLLRQRQALKDIEHMTEL